MSQDTAALLLFFLLTPCRIFSPSLFFHFFLFNFSLSWHPFSTLNLFVSSAVSLLYVVSSERLKVALWNILWKSLNIVFVRISPAAILAFHCSSSPLILRFTSCFLSFTQIPSCLCFTSCFLSFPQIPSCLCFTPGFLSFSQNSFLFTLLRLLSVYFVISLIWWFFYVSHLSVCLICLSVPFVCLSRLSVFPIFPVLTVWRAVKL